MGIGTRTSGSAAGTRKAPRAAARKVKRAAEPVSVRPSGTKELRERAAKLAELNLDFVRNRKFSRAGAPETWGAEVYRGWRSQLDGGSTGVSADFEETDISRLCDTGLLTPPLEAELFRTMNLLKYGAAILRGRLDANRPSRVLVERIEAYAAEAEGIRNPIEQEQARPVNAIVKRLVGPQHHFDEFVSDGMLSLMQVVEKFDFDRGFRFSTYAYRAITRTVYRKMVQVHKLESRHGTGMDEVLMEIPNRNERSLSERTWSNLRELLGEFLQQLDPRERRIIRARYALDDESKGATFQSLADDLGVSKERVRQLERRAFEKLQALASQVDLDRFVEASCA